MPRIPVGLSGVPILIVVAALAACARPVPGPNPAAAAVQAPPDVPLASRPTVGQEAGAVVRNQVQVSFTEGGTRLSEDADQQLDLAARLFRDAKPVAMFVTGHSDSVGTEYANLVISARRAQAVKQALAARGIPADRLLIQAVGASEPVDQAAPSSPENRRVVITWRLT